MPRSPHATLVAEAARTWRERCLLNQGSIFTDEALWTAENVQALVRHYSDNLKEGAGDFFQKFELQLSDAPAAAVRLAAEILWVMSLIVFEGASSGSTKRLHVQRVFSWSGEEIPEDHWALGEVLDRGLAHPGTAYLTHRWRELLFFIEFLTRWTSLSADQRSSLLADPWAFSAWLNETEGASRRLLRHVLCFLLFPDHFEPIVSQAHKEKILDAFGDALPSGSRDSDWDQVQVDRALLRVKESLAEEYGSNLSFYDTAIRQRWQPTARKDEETPADLSEAEAWFRDRFKGKRVWLLAAGEGGRLAKDFLENGIAAIGWDYLGDLDEFESREAITAEIAAESGKDNPRNDSLACWEFARVMEPGDVILLKKGSQRLLAHGVIEAPYRFDDDRPECRHTRKVQWTAVKDWVIRKDQRVATKTLTDFTSYPQWVQNAFGWIEPSDEYDPPDDGPLPYTMENALQDLFIPEAELRQILDALARQRNVILQGPPGVGKTFVARRLAWLRIGERKPENIEFVQFHQSYSYEDFIQGYRPDGKGGFELRNGVFHRFCTRASQNPEEPHVFIIDEINRGNLSRILGELLMLIEADKRGPDFSVSLTYGREGERFHVPENVHILGMMNTADRSLAIVDYALRRRFAFFALRPAFGSEAFTQFLTQAGVEEEVIREIDERFRALNQEITRDDQNLGPGFEIGHSYFVPIEEEASLDFEWYRGIVRSQILPLLREYWIDRPEQVRRYAEALGVG